jgi:TusA-related sulfurtransferase
MTTVDARGKSCPMPIVLLAKAIRGVPVGQHLIVQADDRAFPQDVEAWCKKTGNLLVKLDREGAHFSAEIRRDQ